MHPRQLPTLHPSRSSVKRRFLVVGNGPSVSKTLPDHLDLGTEIIRVNGFFFESKYQVGRRADILQLGGDPWIFPFFAKTIRKVIRNKEYDILSWSCHSPKIQKAARMALPIPEVACGFRDEATRRAISAIIERHGKSPTTGVWAILTAFGLGADVITLVGFDLYETEQRYQFAPGPKMQGIFKDTPNKQGYNLNKHSKSVDLEVIEYLNTREDVLIYRANDFVSSLNFLELSPVVNNAPWSHDKVEATTDLCGWVGPFPIALMSFARRYWNRLSSLLKPAPGKDA